MVSKKEIVRDLRERIDALGAEFDNNRDYSARESHELRVRLNCLESEAKVKNILLNKTSKRLDRLLDNLGLEEEHIEAKTILTKRR